MDDNYAHISILLDRSGSMAMIRDDMEGGLRQFVTEQQAEPGKTTFALYQFDDRYDVVIPPTTLADVKVNDIVLVPRGSTALLDAMSRSIAQTGEYLAAMPETERPGKVLFLIVTDGYENASREVTRAQVMDKVTEQEGTYGWKFVYLGANQDAIAVAATFGVATASTYAGTGAGAHNTWVANSAATKAFRVSKCYAVASNITGDETEEELRNTTNTA